MTNTKTTSTFLQPVTEQEIGNIISPLNINKSIANIDIAIKVLRRSICGKNTNMSHYKYAFFQLYISHYFKNMTLKVKFTVSPISNPYIFQGAGPYVTIKTILEKFAICHTRCRCQAERQRPWTSCSCHTCCSRCEAEYQHPWTSCCNVKSLSQNFKLL